MHDRQEWRPYDHGHEEDDLEHEEVEDLEEAAVSRWKRMVSEGPTSHL